MIFVSSLLINAINWPLAPLPAKFQAVRHNEAASASPCLFHLLIHLDLDQEACAEYPLVCTARQGVCRSLVTRHVTRS